MTEFNQSFGLSRLANVKLKERFLSHYEVGMQKCKGSGFYQNRMKIEFHDYLALAQVSNRIEPIDVSFEGTFRLNFLLRVKFPRKDHNDDVVVSDCACLILSYPESAIREPQKGTDFVQIIGANAYHPNISPTALSLPFQGLCLGASVLRGVRVRELILMSYGLLSLQSITMDVYDSAGLLNPEAGEYWQQNHNRIPLSNEPFLQT